jgi:hypothetical protein
MKGHQEIGGCSSIVGATDTCPKNNDDDDENDDVEAAQRRLRSQVKDLQDRLLSGSNEFYSRAFHASEAGMTEIGRGHFLPFLIVTFAALARLRALLLRLQTKIKLVDIPAMLQTMDSVGKTNGVDTASMQSLRAALVLLRDSIVLVSDPRTDVVSAASASLQEAERHVQLLANLGITRATEKLQKGRVQTQSTNLTEPDERSSQWQRDICDHDDIGHKMTHTEDQGAPDAPPTTRTVVDALDGNADFLTMVRDNEKNKKKRRDGKLKETTAAAPKKKKKSAKSKKGDFFDELFG